jgi:hypothetical protein
VSQIIGTDPSRTDHHAADPEREQQDEQRLAHAARDAQIPRGEICVGAATVERSEAEVRDGRREERLAGIREADRAVEPEERAHGEHRGGRERGRPVVDRQREVVDDEGRQAAERDRERDIGCRRIVEPRVDDAPEHDVEDVARRVRLVLEHIVLAQRQGKLHGVPVVEQTRPVREARDDRQERERGGEEEI